MCARASPSTNARDPNGTLATASSSPYSITIAQLRRMPAASFASRSMGRNCDHAPGVSYEAPNAAVIARAMRTAPTIDSGGTMVESRT